MTRVTGGSSNREIREMKDDMIMKWRPARYIWALMGAIGMSKFGAERVVVVRAGIRIDTSQNGS